MTRYSLFNILLHNIVRSRHRYLGYLGAITFAVATFFAFGFLLFHPTLQSQLGGDVSSALGQLLIIGQVGVGLFAIFFVLFFHRFLLRLRSQEFGLLLTLGIAPRALQRVVRGESLVLAIVALSVGLALGFAEALILFQIIAAPLNVASLEPHFSARAIVYGFGFFIVLFSIDTYISTRNLRRLTPKTFLTIAKSNQKHLAVSWRQLAVGVACIIGGYMLALGFQDAGAGFSSAVMLPVALLVSVGTYLLFSQCLVAVLLKIRRTTTIGLTLISASRLAHRSRDFARVLTVVTLLHAAVLTLVGVALAILSHLHQMATSSDELKIYLQLFSILLFVFFFLTALFLIAGLCTLWVKLFTQIDEDRQQFSSLRRIGLSVREIRSILSHELGVLFFVPGGVATIHAMVALGAFTTKVAPPNLSQKEAWLYFSYAAVAYIICIFIYFIVARWSYVRALVTR